MSSRPGSSDRDAHVAAHSYKYDEATDSFVPSSYRWPAPAKGYRWAWPMWLMWLCGLVTGLVIGLHA